MDTHRHVPVRSAERTRIRARLPLAADAEAITGHAREPEHLVAFGLMATGRPFL